MMKKFKFYLLVLLMTGISMTMSACSSVDIKTTKVVPITHELDDIPESELLDVGIRIFQPGLERLDELDEGEIVFPEIRIAEANYFPHLLMESLQTSAAWGAVRVVPRKHDSVDVLIKGNIVKSDGEVLSINIEVVDSLGQVWFTKQYDQKASRYSYDKKLKVSKEPFQNMYNLISNDLNAYRKQLSAKELIKIRQVAELKFAQSFAPKMFLEHLTADNSGIYSINRLPAEGDPMMARIRQVRERDYLFVDTLQEYYSRYAKQMEPPYLQWRSESYGEVLAMRTMESKARNQKIFGAVAIIAGIIGAGNSSGSVRAAGAIGVTAGAYVLKDGYERDAESQIHIEVLQELGDSLEASMENNVVELEDRTVTLSGTVENQYQQWREILQNIYKINQGVTLNENH